MSGEHTPAAVPEIEAERNRLRAEVECLKASAPNPKFEDALFTLEQAVVNQYKTENAALRAKVERLEAEKRDRVEVWDHGLVALIDCQERYLRHERALRAEKAELETLQERAIQATFASDRLQRLETEKAELAAALERCKQLSEAALAEITAIDRGCDSFIVGQIGQTARDALVKITAMEKTNA